MKGQYCYFLFLTLSLPLYAQSPVINRDDLIMIGDMYAQAVSPDVPAEGAAGAGVTWDFSGVTGNTPVAFQVGNPASTPYSAEFPGANIALIAENNQVYQYQALNQGSWEDHGYVSLGTIAFQLVYTEPRLRFQFPMAYLGSWSDSYTYVIDYQTNPPITTNGEGTVNAVVDGYGKLILPQATFDNALRVRIFGESTDTTDLGFGLYERNYFHDTTYLWLSPSWPAPICSRSSGSLLRITTVVQGGNTMQFEETESFSSFSFDPTAEPMPSAVSEITPGSLNLEITPNPFSEAFRLTFESAMGGPVDIRMYDSAGRMVLQEDMVVAAGSNTAEIRPQAPEPGAYVILVRTGDRTDVQKALCVRK